jgi:hypothetical protein
LKRHFSNPAWFVGTREMKKASASGVPLINSRRVNVSWPLSGLGAARIRQLSAKMSCRMSINMAKRAAAGAMKISAWSEDETDAPLHATDHIPIPWRNKQRGSNRTVALTRNPAWVFAMALSLFVALFAKR